MSTCKELLAKFISSSEKLGECKSGLFQSQMGNGTISQSDCDKIQEEINSFLAKSPTKEARKHLQNIHSHAENLGYTSHRDLAAGDLSQYRRGQLFASIITRERIKSEEEAYCSLMARSESP